MSSRRATNGSARRAGNSGTGAHQSTTWPQSQYQPRQQRERHICPMPPVECTSAASGAEAPYYSALSPLDENHLPFFMDFNHQPLMHRHEVFLSSAALPDVPSPLIVNMNLNYDSYGFFEQQFQTSNDNFHQNSYESETSNIFKTSCEVLEGKDSNMAMESTASNKQIPDGFLVLDTPEDNKIKQELLNPLNAWSRTDVIDWFGQYGANKERLETVQFTSASNLHQMLMDNPEGYAKMLNMGTMTLQKACESLFSNSCTSAHPYMSSSSHMFPNGNLELQHEVKQESNSQVEYPWDQQHGYACNPDAEYTSEEDTVEYEPQKPLEVPRRTGKRGRPPSILSKAAAKRKEKGHGKLWEFIRDLLKDRKYCPSLICWENHDEGVFRFVSSEKVAKLWGDKRKNSNMTYEKLSRAMRYYYKSKILLPVTHRRLVYKFGPNAVNWRCEDPNFARSS